MTTLRRLLDRILMRSRARTTRVRSGKGASTSLSPWNEGATYPQDSAEPRGEKIYVERNGRWVFTGYEEPEPPPPYDPFMHDY
jgi:hypothetical protein